jgi:putative peptidoglycan lipid II flippase
LDGRRIVSSLWRYVAAALVSAAAGVAVLFAFGGLTDGFAVSGFFAAIVSIAVVGIIMAAVYIGVLTLLRSPDLRDGLAPIANRLRRG